jgi:hypothetical protein
MTRRILIPLGLIACLALPAAALGHAPSKADKHNAAKECRAERGSTDASKEAFAAKYGTNANHKNAFGKCVSKRAHEEQAQRRAAKKSAVRDCRAERKADASAFKAKYGSFGKCVSRKAKQNKAAADRRDRAEIRSEHKAAKACAQERSTLGEQAFDVKYGTSKNKHGNGNAFGKCVSQHVKSQS